MGDTFRYGEGWAHEGTELLSKSTNRERERTITDLCFPPSLKMSPTLPAQHDIQHSLLKHLGLCEAGNAREVGKEEGRLLDVNRGRFYPEELQSRNSNKNSTQAWQIDVLIPETQTKTVLAHSEPLQSTFREERARQLFCLSSPTISPLYTS